MLDDGDVWHHLVDDRDGRIRDIVASIATAAGDDAPPTDLAVLRAYLASDDTVADRDDAATRALAHAVRTLPESPHPGLYGGAARTAWTVAHLAGGAVADATCGAVDRALVAALDDWAGDYDLIAGVVGLGVYALERGNFELACAIARHLEQRATPRAGGLAWFSEPALLSDFERGSAPEGYWNLGLAHGAPGAIALLARFVAAGIERARCEALLDAAVAYVLAAAPCASVLGGRFPTWQPTHAPASPRLAWCYGDLSVALALVGAGVLAKRASWRALGVELARDCAARSYETAAISDAGICHGAAGIAHLFHRMARATGDDVLLAAAAIWIDRLVAMHHVVTDRSLLTGATGVALVLHAAISDVEPSWDRLLLADLPSS